MRRVALIYNPASGQRPAQRAAMIAKVQAVLEGAGVDVRVIATESPESAGEQAQQAIADGCDTVLVCGRDGTAYGDAAQHGYGAARRRDSDGTANALASADLELLNAAGGG